MFALLARHVFPTQPLLLFAEVKKSRERVFAFFWKAFQPHPFGPFAGAAMQKKFADLHLSIEEDDATLRFLQPRYVQMIDDALSALGEFGEVRLVVEKGRLRFLVTQKSYDMLKWHPGVTIKDVGP
jgi:hypothetical protein